MTDHPIACTLSPESLQGRLALIEALASDALLAHEPIAGGLRAHFRDGLGVEGRVRELAAAESACCAFLGFDVRRDGRSVLLEVTGPAEAQPVIEEYFSALGAQEKFSK